MNFQPLNLLDLVGITGGILIVLIPVMGATIRFTAKPLIEALKSAGLLGAVPTAAGNASARDLELLSRRVLELEQELAKVKAPALVAQSTMDGQVVPIDRQILR
jgi:hypothetical protein